MKEETKKATRQEKKEARALEALAVEKYFRSTGLTDELLEVDFKVLVAAYEAARESLLAALDARLLRWLCVLTYDFEEKPRPEKVEECAARVGSELPYGMRAYWLQVWRRRLQNNLYKYRLSRTCNLAIDFGV